jgi:hypothetical protein
MHDKNLSCKSFFFAMAFPLLLTSACDDLDGEFEPERTAFALGEQVVLPTPPKPNKSLPLPPIPRTSPGTGEIVQNVNTLGPNGGSCVLTAGEGKTDINVPMNPAVKENIDISMIVERPGYAFAFGWYVKAGVVTYRIKSDGRRDDVILRVLCQQLVLQLDHIRMLGVPDQRVLSIREELAKQLARGDEDLRPLMLSFLSL